MKQLVAAIATLMLVVSSIVLATSLRSSAQEDGSAGDDTPTTTVAGDDDTTSLEDDVQGFFEFRSDGLADFEELKNCLTEQGIEIPDDLDRGFRFELRGIEGLSEALEACGLPGFGGPFSFEGELPEGFPFGGGFLRGFPFEGEFPDDFELPENFPFELPDDFPFEFPDDFPFDDELPEGFAFGGPDHFGFDFGFGLGPLDRDALAECLAELGSFENVDEVRGQLDECLPEFPERGEFGGLKGFGGRGFGGWFDFDFGENPPFSAPTTTVPEGADTSA